jgi:hypothetical protein
MIYAINIIYHMQNQIKFFLQLDKILTRYNLAMYSGLYGIFLAK